MAQSEIDRREFVFGLAGAAGSAWLAAHAFELRAISAYAASIDREEPYQFFTPEQARDHDAVSAQIIPTDDTPGAREAHAVRFADRFYATVFKEAQPAVRNDFKLLGDSVAERTPGNRSFAVLGDADQIALLTAFEKANPESFSHFRGITMLGMFSHPIHGGNFNKIGWKLIGFEDRYAWTPPFGYYDRP